MDVGVPASPTPMQVTGVMPAAVGMTTTNLGFHAGALPTGEPAPASAQSYSLPRRGTQPAASGATTQGGHPAASKHAATSPRAASSPGDHGTEHAGEARIRVDHPRVAA